MKYTKEKIESELYNLLYDLLSNGNQESGIISVKYDEESQTCDVKLDVHIVEEDDYIGFDTY